MLDTYTETEPTPVRHNRSFSITVDILPSLKSGASPSLTSLRPLGIEPNGRRSHWSPPLEKGGFSKQAPWIKAVT